MTSFYAIQKFSKQEEAYIRGKELDHTFYFAKDLLNCTNGEKHVSSFKTIDDFLSWFDKQKI